MPSTHSPIFIPQITLIAFLYFLVLSPRPSLSFNITALLSTFPEFSQFTALIAPLSDDLSHRSSLSLLAVPNSVLSSDDRLSRHQLTPSTLPDVLRYHVLLQYLSWSDLRSLPPSGKLITTLYQTTGRATGNLGSVNLTCDPVTGLVSIHPPTPSSSSSAATNATVLSLVKTLPYNVTIFSVNALLIPGGFDLMASETGPTSFINITKALIDGHNFNVVASLLSASGVVEEFESDEGGAGITLFVPVDDAFADLPASISLQSLPADKKAVVLRFHVLHSYYPLGSLQSITNPSQPTLATEAMGAGFYTLNISAFNGSLAINSGIVQASVTQTVFDEKPVSIFGISRVLLPKEIFGKNPIVSSRTAPQDGAPPPEEDAHSPETSPGLDGSPSHLSSPPGLRDDVLSEGVVHGSESFVVVVVLCCIGLYLVV
ncbi:fasciclin-like arabinogalactan protein 4 [Lotus japonicus]|uniref:fasciclin-like arabinogalactan protein 4 n=1 Tax=Lotus japonicus TaxID=34305 RepID=UPI0025875FF0|nr:fasciclin-like arabinogalactan protein 4 [Lotus japonicus]